MPNIKLLFTCPHGGTTDPRTTDPPTHLIERVEDHLDTNICKADEGQGFSDENDKLTKDLTEIICENITKLSGGKEPYKEIAKFHRRFIDYNRKKECAFEVSSLAAEKAYLEYHDGISQKINEMFSQNENGLAFLFDIHGFSEKVDEHRNPFDVIVGNDQGYSIRALNKADPGAFWGDNGLIPLLKINGYNVLPRNLNERLAGHSLDGGYTIQKYSSDEPGRGLVAIQIEVALSIREDDNRREEFAANMADYILRFVSPLL